MVERKQQVLTCTIQSDPHDKYFISCFFSCKSYDIQKNKVFLKGMLHRCLLHIVEALATAIAATQQIKGSASKLIVMHGFLYYLFKNESDHTVMKSFFSIYSEVS